MPLQQLLQQSRQPAAQFAARVASHRLDLLSEILPGQLGVVDQLADGTATEQRRLRLGPEDEVIVVLAIRYGSPPIRGTTRI
jgi:hypothetical protein